MRCAARGRRSGCCAFNAISGNRRTTHWPPTASPGPATSCFSAAVSAGPPCTPSGWSIRAGRKFAHFREPAGLYRLARRFESRHEHTRLAWAARLTRQAAWWNPVAPMPEVGGDPALHGVEPDEREVYLPLAERVGHMVVVGTTRTGKSRFLELLVAQDIRRGETVIVFDPKGDADVFRRVYAEAKRAGRLAQFHFFHLGYPHCSARYNPVGDFARITEVATRIANNMPSGGDAESFKQFVWKYINGLVRAMVALGRKPSYRALHRYAENFEPLILDYLSIGSIGSPRPPAGAPRSPASRSTIPAWTRRSSRAAASGETARLRETQAALRLDRQCAGLGGHLRELLFPEAGRLALSVPGESDHRRDCRPGLARLREPGRSATGVRLDDDPEQRRHRLCRARFAGRLRGGGGGGQLHVRRSHQRGGQASTSTGWAMARWRRCVRAGSPSTPTSSTI